MLKSPSISVIVATHNRARLLDECLTHIKRQRFVSGDEVIVVDNGSTDDTPSVLARYHAACPAPLGTLYEPQPGKSHALARALAVAVGDVLAFTDDDVNVEDGWLDAIRTAMADRTVALVGGPIAPRWERAAPAWLHVDGGGYGRLAAPLALLDYGPAPAALGDRAALGANMAVRRDVIARVGGFAPHLGKLRGTLLSGEDHDLCQRIQSAGYAAAYCPAVRVTHWVPADRVRLRYVLHWFFWSGITHARLDDREGTPGAAWLGVPRYLVRRFVFGLAGAVAALAIGRRARAVERAADAAFAAGYAAARWGLAPMPVSGAMRPVEAGS